MKKTLLICLSAVAAILAALAFFWGMMYDSGEEVLLLDYLPQGEWLEFYGHCVSPSYPGFDRVLYEYRQEVDIPDELLGTAPEPVRAALEGITVRTGRAAAPRGGCFQYRFLLPPETDCELTIYKNGCIELWINSMVIENHEVLRGSSSTLYFHDDGEAYDALDARFLNVKEQRALMGLPN